MEKLCFLFGHGDTPVTVLPLLREAIAAHYHQYGIRCFVVGHYGGFDRLAAAALAQQKQLLPDIRLQLLLPYHPAERPVALPEGFDGSLYPDGMERVPRRVAVSRANRMLVDLADSLICYARFPGRASDLLAYARKKPVPLTNLAQ